MNRLSKADLKRRDEITKKLTEAFSSLQDDHRVFTEALGAYNAKIEAFNEIIEEARGFAQDMVSEIDSYMSEKSERWLDGDRGQAYEAWKDEFACFYLEDIPPVEDMGEPDFECDVLDNLPEEPNV